MSGDHPSSRSPKLLPALYELAVSLPVLTWLAITLAHRSDELTDPTTLFFILAVAIVDLIPVPAWGGLQLSLSFPILLGVAIIYSAPVAAFIALVGSADPREFRREIGVLKAVFNRSQMALSIAVGGALFHSLAQVASPWYRLVPAVLASGVLAYAVNALCVAVQTSLYRNLSVMNVLRKMHGTAPLEFLLSYIGLGLFGAVIARFHESVGVWSVGVFLAPLVFARQMYFRSRALADRLAEQNQLLAEQAQRLEELLEKEHETVKELRELNRMKGDFVAVVSHELRTPVTALIGYAKTLRRAEFADDAQLRGEFLERMERQGDRLLRLVENLLTASNLENKQLPISLGRVLVEDVCREIVEGLGSEAARIEMVVPHNIPVIHTDRQLLVRVISNLVDNALKYSPDGSLCELGGRMDGDTVVLWVRDHGVGIAPEEVHRIFDRFYQVDSSPTRTFRGAGLGLSLVRELLQHLGGAVSVESEEGQGSTFTVRLPIRHPDLGAEVDASVPALRPSRAENILTPN